jgi:hypothetical protein
VRPVPITDEMVTSRRQRIVVGAPGGDLLDGQVAPVEALVEQFGGAPLLSVRVVLEGDDLERLTRGEHVWLRFWGHMVPFEIEVGP